MRRWLVFPLICTSVFSQNSTLANNSNTEDNAGFVVRINVNLVQVDAEVTDMHGKPATDLKADDFKVLQDGVPQTINDKLQALLEAVAMVSDENGNAKITQRTDNFSTTDKDFALAVKNGVILKMQQAVEKPGAYHVRVAVRDRASQKMGSANQFTEVPDLKRGHLAISGIVLKQLDSDGKSAGLPDEANQAPALDPKGNEAIRIFRPGEKIGWFYQILNAKNGPDQHASLQIQVRLFHDGKEMTRTEPAAANLPQNPAGKRLATSGHMLLTSKFAPGDYALQLVVTDALAKKKYATASQSIDFEVEDPLARRFDCV